MEKMLNPANFSAISNIFVSVLNWFKTRQSGSVYKRFFERSPILFCVLNREGEFIILNPAFAEELGYPAERLKGGKYLFFVHPDDQSDTIEVMERLREGAEVFGFRNRYRCMNGHYKTFEWDSIGNGEIHCVARIIQ